MVVPKHELETKLREENNLIRSGVLRDENPLDLSDDFNEFLEACRRGDLKRCQELMSAGVNINGKDAFDYTPLIVVSFAPTKQGTEPGYSGIRSGKERETGLLTNCRCPLANPSPTKASLCGHFDLVRFLLESGAIAERNTFQGERCIYNALNDKIRKLLIQYDYSKSTDPLQPWSSHITSLLSIQTPRTADITLVGGAGEASATFDLHKFLLAARTPYFRQKLADAQEAKSWKLASSVPVEATRVVLRYLYLEELPREFASPGGGGASEDDIFKGIDRISRSLEVEHLWDAVLASNDRRLARQRYQDEVQRAEAQLETFFRDNVLAHKIVVDADAAKDVRWSRDNAIFADCLVQADEAEPEEDDVDNGTPAEPSESTIPVGPLEQGGRRRRPQRPRRSTLYPVHKAMLIRSPYFQTMFSGPFLEAQETEHLRIVKVDCVPEVLEVVLSFLYTENADCRLELALDLLYAADMLLLDKLKSRAAGIISALGSGNSTVTIDKSSSSSQPQKRERDDEGPAVETEPINIYDVIRAAWDLRVQRLEEFAARYIAARLEHYIDEPEFAEMIQESAARIKNREETDTIELLDDIRYYLSERFRLRFEDAGWEQMMSEEERPPPAVGAGEVVSAGSEDLARAPALGGKATSLAGTGPTEDVKECNGPREPTGQDGPQSAWISTLDGTLVEDEFEADAANYQLLLRKIDDMLERLKLDA